MNGIVLYVIWDIIIRLNSMPKFIDFHADFVDIIFILVFITLYYIYIYNLYRVQYIIYLNLNIIYFM